MVRVRRLLIAPLLLMSLMALPGVASAEPSGGTQTITIDSQDVQMPADSGVVVQDDARDGARPQQVVTPPAAEGSYVLKPDGTIDLTDTMKLRHDDPAITNSPDAEIVVFPTDAPTRAGSKETVAAGKTGTFPPILVTVYRRVKNVVMVSDHRHPLLASRSGRRPVYFYTKVAEKVDIAPIILKYSEKFDLDPYLVKAVIKTESSFSPHATSWCGAAGLMQLMPFTARRMGASHIYDIEENIAAGTRYLHYLMGLFGGKTEHVVAAYNAGEGAVQHAGGIPHIYETQQYVKKVMGSYRAYKQAAAEE